MPVWRYEWAQTGPVVAQAARRVMYSRPSVNGGDRVTQPQKGYSFVLFGPVNIASCPADEQPADAFFVQSSQMPPRSSQVQYWRAGFGIVSPQSRMPPIGFTFVGMMVALPGI